MLFPQHDTQVSHPHHVTRNVIDLYILIFEVKIGKWKTIDTETRGKQALYEFKFPRACNF